MRNTLLFAFTFLTIQLFAQVTFMNGNMNFEDSDIHSGISVAVFDMDGDRLDDMVRFDQGTDIVIDYQQIDGTFVRKRFQSVGNDSQWSCSVADIDNNGYGDIMLGGRYDNIKVYFANSDGTAFDEFIMPGATIFAQCSNIADINNDGFLDAFVCHDDGESRIWKNMKNGSMDMADDWIDMSTTPASDNSGNYGSVWTDFDLDGDLDLFIAKCRQFVADETDARRINVLYKNDGNGNFTEAGAEHGLRNGNQSWAVDFGDFDNDGDLDCFIVNHNTNAQLMENDGNGIFTDISAGSGIPALNFPLQTKMVDMDNDGFLDIIVSGEGHEYLHNNGDQTFTPVADFLGDDELLTFSVGDLNHDGFPDINGGYGNTYTNPSNRDDILWLNEKNNNNWIVFDLEGTDSNRSAVGAKVIITGPWGTQIREVRSGESYGVSNTQAVMFGLGTATNIDEVRIEWPSGNVENLTNVSVNQHIYVQEEGCISGGLSVEASGPTIICAGEQVTLSVPAGFDSYDWSNGGTGNSITVTESGSYKVIVKNGDCEANSNIIQVVVDPDETPTIMQGADIIVCPGEEVMLTSSEADGYTWSNGMTSQSIMVTESGTYSVTIPGLCSNFTSANFELMNYDTDLETVGDTVMAGETATLQSSGLDPQWYDQPDNGTLLGSGSEFVTGAITATTTYYVESEVEIGSGPQTIGEPNDNGNGMFTSGAFTGLELEIIEPTNLIEVMVFAGSAGMRTISFFDFSNNSFLGGFDADLVEGKNVITTDFALPATPTLAMYIESDGDLYSLTDDFDFPYLAADGSVEINGSLQSTRYDYFFNLKFQKQDGAICQSEREPVIAMLDTDVSTRDFQDDFELTLFPNPTAGTVFIQTSVENMNLLRTEIFNGVGARIDVEINVTENAMDLSHLAAGVYFVNFTNTKGSVTRRVVIQ